MSIHLYSPTQKAIFLLGLDQGNHSPRLFPSQPSWQPGLHLETRARQPINIQIVERTRQELGFGVNLQTLDIFQDFSEALHGEGQEGVVTLYTGVLKTTKTLGLVGWKTLPEILRNLPSDRRRLAYMKALQIHAGGLSSRTRAAELSHKEMSALKFTD